MPNVVIPCLDLAGEKIPVLGQGTWNMGEVLGRATAEAEVLQTGIDLGLTLIDTAELYGNGGAERVVGRAIAGRDVFLVSKITPENAHTAGVARHCDASLKRLGVEIIDLYLLHWPGRHPLAATIAAFENLKVAGKIRHWGVSNFDLDKMPLAPALPGGRNCVTNQVLYHPGERGIEFDLLPWSRSRMPVMAYSPLGQGGRLLRASSLLAVAKRHGATPAQVALAWGLRDGNVISIPKTSSRAHLLENAAAVELQLSPQDFLEIDEEFPPPRRKQALAMI